MKVFYFRIDRHCVIGVGGGFCRDRQELAECVAVAAEKEPDVPLFVVRQIGFYGRDVREEDGLPGPVEVKIPAGSTSPQIEEILAAVEHWFDPEAKIKSSVAGGSEWLELAKDASEGGYFRRTGFLPFRENLEREMRQGRRVRVGV